MKKPGIPKTMLNSANIRKEAPGNIHLNKQNKTQHCYNKQEAKSKDKTNNKEGKIKHKRKT